MSGPAANIIVYAITGILVAMFIVYTIPVKCHASVVQEGFANPDSNTKCPPGTKTFTDRLGNLSCCNGQVNGSTCEGSITCSFSSNAGKDIPICRPPVTQLVTDFKNGFCAQFPGSQLQAARIEKCEYDNVAQGIKMDSQNRLVSKMSGMCMDIYGNNTANGTPIVEYPCHAGLNQKWNIIGKRITSFMNGNKCLTVDSSNNKTIVIGDCSGDSPNQRWALRT